MFFSPLTDRKSITFLVLHLLLGVVSLFTPVVMAAWLWITVLLGLYFVLRLPKKHMAYSLLPLAYVGGMEIAARVAKTSPLLPYEFAKYFYLVFLLICVIRFKVFRAELGFFMIVLLLPAIVFIPGDSFRVYFVNSFLGIFLLALLVHVYRGRLVESDLLKDVFRFYLFGLSTLLVQVIGGTGDLESLEFELGANFATAGGFGSNQVSTLLGIGVMILGLSWLLRWEIFMFSYLNIGLLGLFLLRAILTFSRGGVLGALLSILMAYFVPKPRSGMRKVNIGYVLLILVLSALAFLWVNELTDGVLVKRYQGETYATQLGVREVDLETLTSRRSSLMVTEWEIFLDHPIFGVGPGAGYEERAKATGFEIASHTEVTRLLAEHGLFGLIISLIFLFYPIFDILSKTDGLSRFLSTAFFILAIFTSFHAAMRTTVTPFFWGLACMRFKQSQ